MNETYKFLKENTQVNYISTINEGKPSCRPFGDPIMVDNKIYDIYFIKQSKIASFFFGAFKNPTSKNAVLTLLLN